MKTRYISYPALIIAVLVLAACAQQTKPPNLPKEVTGTPAPYTGEAGGGKGTGEIAPGLTVYQVNPDGSSQQIGGNTPPQESAPAIGTDPDVKGMVITKEGFNPSTLTFKTGTKLIIQNSDSAMHQPASDPHPVHTDCPELNSDKPLAMGEFLEVTLTGPKTCGFHDHLNPGLKATITVTE
jgi:hypothetical protein